MLNPSSVEARAEYEVSSQSPIWYRKATFYQIYPLSFQDSNGDGKGDLPGLISRIEYLSWLGADALWLGPIYSSPLLDWGFDISDFTAVDPLFGTLDDLDRLIEELHRRGMRLILDVVPNHTSDQHPWFQESRATRDNPKRDWYIWRDPAPGGGPPNNWLSRFGGSAWELDQRTRQYYYHAFLKEQPDLNWRNPQVRTAMAEILRFWMRRGVDGFRIDAAAVLAEDELLRNDPPNLETNENTTPAERLKRVYTNYRPEVLDWLAGLRRVADEFPDRVLLGEVDTSRDRVADFYGTQDRPILQGPLNYRLVEVAWKAEKLADAINGYVECLPPHAMTVWGIGSHDKKRIASSVGQAQARIAAMLALTLGGVAIFYAGDEIGMENVPIPSEEARDSFERQMPGYGMNRDPERAPMQWDAHRNAGFTCGTPWLPVADDYVQRNVEQQRHDPASMLNFYRKLLALRHAEPALACGTVDPASAHGDVLTYTRTHLGRRFAVILNISGVPQSAALPAAAGKVALSTHLDHTGEASGARIALRADEGVIVELDY